jgi:hypothetical protein
MGDRHITQMKKPLKGQRSRFGRHIVRSAEGFFIGGVTLGETLGRALQGRPALEHFREALAHRGYTVFIYFKSTSIVEEPGWIMNLSPEVTGF